MPKIKVYSPPIITAKGKIKLGHGANLVWCDILARVMSRSGFSIDYFFPSWNHQGKMFDHLAKDQCLENSLFEIESSLVKKISLFGLNEYTPYRDTSIESRKNAQDKFNILLRKGFIDLDKGAYFLKIDKIREQTGLVDHIKGANFFPEGGKLRVLDLIKTLDGSYPITKSRDFATPIPGNNLDHKINPIFDLAVSPCMFSETSVDYSIDGLKTMLHGTFIPFVIYSGLFDIPFSRNVAIHGYLLPCGPDEDNFEEFYKKTNQDILRGSALMCTNSMEDTLLDPTRVKKIIKGTSKLIKLAWFFKNFEFPLENMYQPLSPNIEKGIKGMHHIPVMDNVLERTYSLSGRLGESRLNEKDYQEYLCLLNDSQVFFPFTFEKAANILKKNLKY